MCGPRVAHSLDAEMGRYPALVLAGMLASCAAHTVPVASTVVCPSVKEYSAAEQQQAVKELQVLGPGSELGTMIQDFFVERQMLRACQASGATK